jgi:hypothetical protein
MVNIFGFFLVFLFCFTCTNPVNIDKKYEDLSTDMMKAFLEMSLHENTFPNISTKEFTDSSLRFRLDGEINLKDSEQKSMCKTNSFYNDYLSKYYPKVFAIRAQFVSSMSPEQIAEALQEITKIFAYQPWFYFVNKQRGFNVARYWEYIIDQCSFINDFFKKARINSETKKVFTYSDSGIQAKNKSQSLYLFLKKINPSAIHNFYALCFDYLIKLFNEGILLKDKEQVNKYFHELEFVIARLRNSKYEIDYQEAIKTCKELKNLLKKKLCKEIF